MVRSFKSNYGRCLRSLFVLLLLPGAVLLAAGCSQVQETKGEAAANRAAVSVSDTVQKVEGTDAGVKTEPSPVVPGRYLIAGYSPANMGVAKVEAMPEGRDGYHLSVSVVRGYSHHSGSLELDFVWDPEISLYKPVESEYKDITLKFTENSLTLDYPGKEYGGLNAEPKGTYYLSSASGADAPFLTRLYDLMDLKAAYRGGNSEVFFYEIDDTRRLLLVRSYGTEDKEVVSEEHLALLDTASDELKNLGESAPNQVADNRERLKSLGANEDLIYQVLRKTYFDRLLELEMKKFDAGESGFRDDENYKLTEKEAFYIATGMEGTTRYANNMRDQNDIGSIFMIEVDSADQNVVTVHFYEAVRNSDEDEHTATSDWLEVNRSTGRVSSDLFD